MRGRNLRRTLVAAGLVAASAVLGLVLAGGGGGGLFFPPSRGGSFQFIPATTELTEMMIFKSQF